MKKLKKRVLEYRYGGLAQPLHKKGLIFFYEGVSVSFQQAIRKIRSLLLPTVTLVAFAALLHPASGFAQDGVDRKVKSKVAPAYPEIARKMGLSGVVKLQLVVATNGSVKETKVIGGHPILVTAALDAVKKWRFEPASAESTGTVEFKFAPGE